MVTGIEGEEIDTGEEEFKLFFLMVVGVWTHGVLVFPWA